MSHTAQTTDRPLRTLVLGGARSGKSAFAEQLVASEAVRYVATAIADPDDQDFAERIAAHRARRPAAWTTVEGDPIGALGAGDGATLIDDLGTWLTARIDARGAWELPRGSVGPDIEALVAAVTGYRHRLVIVSPEVGLGVIPGTASGRLFRDELGILNQRLAQVCDEVYLVVAGQALQIKPDRASVVTDAVTELSDVSAAALRDAANPAVAQAVPDVVSTAGTITAADAELFDVDVPLESVGDIAVEADADSPNLNKPRVRIAFGPVAGPDSGVRAAAEERQLQLTKPAGALGRLEQLGNWVAACQGVCPPRQFERARVVIFAGDHGVARHGVSAYPSEVTGQMVANFLHGGAAVNVLARLADATVRVEDIAVEGDTAPEISRHKVRRSSGSIDREDALTEAEVQAALAAGATIADEEIDSGADLLIAGEMGIGNTTPATVLIAAVTDTEPVVAVGRGTGVDDAGWIRKTAAIRDAMWRARPVVKDPVALLRTASGADLTAMAGFLARAAARRTPVILDGVVVTAAALVADQLAPGSRAWWIAGHRSSEPAHKIALDRLELEPLLEMSMRLGEGSGALTALPLVRAAVATLSDMATFADAGVSTADAAETAGA
ncbi:nicotinate-nucleotide--dimethylbenzimidazole phosphoribosyltransferase [Nocardia sp. NPDC088792]|uniref:nicotinate-nucleotide--dimethylbenzimidazole phosphoribosyltransferase n=1 Tax=Nocardia sp. NPDC088792 TaxID=3364332 RepID=UPI00381AB1FA